MKTKYDLILSLDSLSKIKQGYPIKTRNNPSNVSHFQIGLLGSKESGKTFLLSQIILVTMGPLYSPTTEINLKYTKETYENKKYDITFIDGPGDYGYPFSCFSFETLKEKKQKFYEECLTQNFIENYIINSANYIYLVLSANDEKYKEDIFQINRVKSLMNSNKVLIIFHNFRLFSRHSSLNEKIKPYFKNFGFDDYDTETIVIKNLIHPIIYYYSKSNNQYHFFIMNNYEYNSECLSSAFNIVVKYNIIAKFDFLESFNSFFSKNHGFYFQSNEDVRPDNYMFKSMDSNIINEKTLTFNKDFFELCEILKPPLYDEKARLCSSELSYEKEEKDNNIYYKISLPGWKNPQARLINIKGEQYLKISGEKKQTKDFIRARQFSPQKNLKDTIDEIKQQAMKLEKLIKISEETQKYMIEEDSTIFSNGVLVLLINPFNQKIYEKNESKIEINQQIDQVFKKIPIINQEDITIFEDIMKCHDSILYEAYYEPYKINVILTVYTNIDDETKAIFLKEKLDLIQAVSDIKSENLINFYGAFKWMNQNDQSFKIVSLTQIYDITLRDRLSMRIYTDEETIYILLEIIKGLIDLEDSKLRCGNINQKTVALYPEQINKETVLYKYKIFDYDIQTEQAYATNKGKPKYQVSLLINKMQGITNTLEVELNSVNYFSYTDIKEKINKKDINIHQFLNFIKKNLSKSELSMRMSFQDLYDLLKEIKEMTIDQELIPPNETTVVHRTKDKFLEEIDFLKSLFKPRAMTSDIDTSQEETLKITRNPKKKPKDQIHPKGISNNLKDSINFLKVSLIPEEKIDYRDIRILQLETLGVGGFAKVCKGFDLTNQLYIAIKYFLPRNGIEFDEDETEIIAQEQQILELIQSLNKHEFFLSFYGLEKEEEKKASVLMKMENGVCSMKDILNLRREYTQEETVYIIKDLIESFEILENAGVANRDVKPDNFILVKTDQGLYKYKVADFGIGIIVQNNKKISFDTIMGETIFYYSPEVTSYLKNQNQYEEDEVALYDPFLSDVYSLGLTVLFMLGLKDGINTIKKKITENDVSNYLHQIMGQKNDFIIKLLEKMLTYDPLKRSRFKDLKDFINNEYKGPMESPAETKFVTEIEDQRRGSQNPIEKVKNSVKLARLYYNIGNMDKVLTYTKDAFEHVEFTESCYEMEMLRLRGLIYRGKGNNSQAQNVYKRYNGMLKQYKQDVKFDDDENEQETKEDKWKKGFDSLSNSAKNKIIRKFWTIEAKIF